MSEPALARHPSAGVPHSSLDPFSVDFLRDPFPAHEALREAGPIVWLEKYGAYAAARHAEVRQILNDPVTFCSGRGVGLSDFQREKPWRPPSLVLERDPPEHDRARGVLNRALSATVMRSLRGRFAAAAGELAEELAGKVRFDAVVDCAEVYPMMVLPDAIGLSDQGREHLLPPMRRPSSTCSGPITICVERRWRKWRRMSSGFLRSASARRCRTTASALRSMPGRTRAK